MKISIVSTIIFISIFLFGCNIEKKSKLMYLYSKDNSGIVTIISNYKSKERIIANGKHSSKPKDGYVLIDISNKDLINDEIGICWNKNGKVWQVVNAGTNIIVNKLDSDLYEFKTSWDLDERGIPTPKFYRQSDCYTTEFFESSFLNPEGNGYVERK